MPRDDYMTPTQAVDRIVQQAGRGMHDEARSTLLRYARQESAPAAPAPSPAPRDLDTEAMRLKGILQTLDLGRSNRSAYVSHAMLCDAERGIGPCDCGYAEVAAVMTECSACPSPAAEDGLCDPCHGLAAPAPPSTSRAAPRDSDLAPSRNPPGDNPSNGRAKAALADGTPSAASRPSAQLGDGAEMGTSTPARGAQEAGTSTPSRAGEVPQEVLRLIDDFGYAMCDFGHAEMGSDAEAHNEKRANAFEAELKAALLRWVAGARAETEAEAEAMARVLGLMLDEAMEPTFNEEEWAGVIEQARALLSARRGRP